MAACGLERLPSCWDVVLQARVSWANSTACHCVLTVVPLLQPIRYTVQGPNRKQRRGPEGCLCLAQDSKLSPQERGLFGFCASVWGGLLHTNTQAAWSYNIQALLIAPSVWLWRCSLRVLVVAAAALNRMQNVAVSFQAGGTAPASTYSSGTQPLFSSRDHSQHKRPVGTREGAHRAHWACMWAGCIYKTQIISVTVIQCHHYCRDIVNGV